MNILHITSSLRGAESESSRVTNSIVAKLSAANPGATVVHPRPGPRPAPAAGRSGARRPVHAGESRTPVQAARVALDDALIAQAQAADVVVIGAPMYNFGIPVQLKSWFDAIARAGVTFRYTETGPEGLLKGKKVFVATARGGIYPLDADPQVPFVRMLLNFLGMTDHTFVYSGEAMGPEASSKGRAEADATIEAALA